MKIFFSIVFIFLTFNIGIIDTFGAFGFEKIDQDLVGNTNPDTYKTITNLVKYFLTFLSIISIAFVIKGGFQILTAAGDDDKVKSGRKTIIYALVGVFIVIIAYSIVNIAFDAGKSIGNI